MASSIARVLSKLRFPLPVALGGTGATSMGAGAVGTVADTGGVPSGAIIDSGSNANGNWVKWADGTVLLTGRLSPAGLTWTAGTGVRYANSPAVTLPIPILAGGRMSHTMINSDISTLSAYLSAATVGTTTISNIYFSAPGGSTGNSTPLVDYTVWGRWK